MKLKHEIPMHVMLLPGVLVTLIFSYGPMAGLIMAFQNYIPAFGMLKSEWVGLKNFTYIFNLPDVGQVVWNTVYIAFLKIVFSAVVTIVLALLIHEVTQKKLKRTVQTIIYLPYFLSWIILGAILRDMLAMDGIVNQTLGSFGIEPMMFLGNNALFPYLLVVTDCWQTVGFGTIVYLAAISSINPMLYEASVIDGASRLRQVWHITLPGMKPIIVLLLTLSLGSILNAGFDQIFVLYSPMVYESGDVIDTWVYRAGLVDAQFSIATAVGLFRSVVSFILISLSYYLAHKYANYRIF
ncbi:ABC transporter permease [Paenibacillus silvisoli]|uniref:ABC transporter permease n=1 Tax=Paenibacillus silvisoli TaxID=3110539 RepID=UPI002804DB78|nr:ABC transporter permease subunit [Paenibacillus silvisoli]